MRTWILVLVLVLVLVLAACRQSPSRAVLVSDVKQSPPEVLSEWKLFERRAGVLRPARDGLVYELSTPLFSDYAQKLRAIHVPPGTAIRYGEDEFAFPVDTIITKTFYYPIDEGDGGSANVVRKVRSAIEDVSLDLEHVRLLETRLLVNTREGWVALPYVWNDAQTEATLELAGDDLEIELSDGHARERFVYQVPDTNQCASCHAADFGQQRIVPIGVKARHLNRDVAYPNATENQLAHWARNEILSDLPDGATAPSSAQWNDARQDLNARARAYLDINCGHCHSATAAANTSGLLLDATTTDPARLGRCKVPVATGRGSGTGVFDIVPGTPDESILLQRMISTEPDIAMPEIGRALVHEEGVALIRAWIAAMPGDCASPRAIREE